LKARLGIAPAAPISKAKAEHRNSHIALEFVLLFLFFLEDA
jgi:hypothetical protein